MAEKDKISSQKVKRSGIFNFKDTYQFAYTLLKEQGYDITEGKYAEEITGDSKKISVSWIATKKISDYFKIELGIRWDIINLKSVEAEKDGKRIKTNEGSIEIGINGILVKDYDSKWDTSPFTKFLRGLYEKFIIEGRVSQYEGVVAEDVDNLAEQLKSFLTLEGLKLK